MIIPLVFSVDDNYAGPLGVTLCSIFENKAPETELEIYILDGGISAANKNRLNILEKIYNFSLHYLSLNIRLFNNCPENGHLKISAYFRLSAPQLINRDRLLYLDSDIIVLTDLLPLFKQNLDGRAFGAARDILENRLTISKGLSDYFNSGVMVIDCQRWKDKEVSERAMKFIIEHQEKIEFAEQDGLNYVCQDDWQEIAAEYNTQLNEFCSRLKKSPSLIHYTGPIKPWHINYCGREQSSR